MSFNRAMSDLNIKHTCCWPREPAATLCSLLLYRFPVTSCHISFLTKLQLNRCCSHFKSSQQPQATRTKGNRLKDFRNLPPYRTIHVKQRHCEIYTRNPSKQENQTMNMTTHTPFNNPAHHELRTQRQYVMCNTVYKTEKVDHDQTNTRLLSSKT